jgi:hypothetical protein
MRALPAPSFALKQGTLHAGRSTGGDVARTARGAGLRTPSAGTAPAPLQGSSREASLNDSMSEMGSVYLK